MTNADKFIQKFPNLENGGHKCKPFVMDWDLCGHPQQMVVNRIYVFERSNGKTKIEFMGYWTKNNSRMDLTVNQFKSFGKILDKVVIEG